MTAVRPKPVRAAAIIGSTTPGVDRPFSAGKARSPNKTSELLANARAISRTPF
jgi:hypothetical protein